MHHLPVFVEIIDERPDRQYQRSVEHDAVHRYADPAKYGVVEQDQHHRDALQQRLALADPAGSDHRAVFGRNEPEFSWERTDKADLLRASAGL